MPLATCDLMFAIILRKQRKKGRLSGGTSQMPNMYEQQAIPMDKNGKRQPGGVGRWRNLFAPCLARARNVAIRPDPCDILERRNDAKREG
jgi:hypothetical protein